MPDNLPTLVRLHPRGVLDLEDGNLPWQDLKALAWALDTAETQKDLLLSEILPDAATTATLSHWETVYGIRRIGNTAPKRRAAVLARRQLLPDFRPATIESMLEEDTGLGLTIMEPGAFLTDSADSVCDDVGDLVDGAFVFVLDASAVEARADVPNLDSADDLIELAKPAHTAGFIRFDDICCDDLYSRCDRDLLGA